MSIKTEKALTPNTILFHNNATSVGIIVDDSGIDAGADGKKIVKAGTPMAGDLTARQTAFTKAALTGAIKAVFTVQITTAFVADEKIKIEGVEYTAATVEDVAGKKFAVGVSAAAQVTSLLKMVKTSKYDVGAVGGATDKIGFTQKLQDASDTTGPTVTKTSETGVIGDVTKVTDGVDGTSNAVGILLHDVNVTDGDNNGTLVVRGDIKLEKIDAALITDPVRDALGSRILFF